MSGARPGEGEGLGLTLSSARPPCVLQITAEVDRLWASGEARRFAAEIGFSSDAQARIALCVAELASNAAKHGGGGRVEIAEVVLPARGCRVRVEDQGPGLGVVDEALRDGFSEGRFLTAEVPWSERRGLGVGLGAVSRLMSEVRVLSSSSAGLTIEAVLWLAPGRPPESTRR